MADCEVVFGRYLHHEPSHGTQLREEAKDLPYLFETKTQALYFKEFGEYLYEVRSNAILAKLWRYAKSRLRRAIR